MSEDRQKTVAIVQARMGSSRLPAKTLARLAGRPLLEHVIVRLSRCKNLHEICVATTDLPEDDPIEQFASARNIPVFRGNEKDVLDRYYQAAKVRQAEVIVRITGDCPLIDPKVVDLVVAQFFKAGVDFASNTLRYTYPEGLDVEVFSFASLETAWREAKNAIEREHVTPYLKNHEQFKKINVERKEDLSHLQFDWSVDRKEDLEFVEELLSQLPEKEKDSGAHEAVVDLLIQNPQIAAKLATRIHNEGYYLSLLKDGREAAVPNRSLEKSESWLQRSLEVIPLATQTFSKASSQFVRGVAPVFLERGEGCRVWDVDGNEYIDYVLALCPIVLGYADPAVDRAVKRQLKKGVSFSLPHPVEVELAEKLVQLIPCAEMVRFGKNGSDVTSGAVRAARAFTGRDLIACCGYHGWQDWYIGTTTRNAGVPKETQKQTLPFTYNHLGSLERIFEQHPGQIAAVIMEPFGVELPTDGFLHKVQALCKKNGALLIFDEIVTGFRMSMGGAQEYFGVTPDLACFGKALANGHPLSAVVGRKEVMKVFEEIFFSFTFGGEAVSIAAAIETLKQLKSRRAIPQIWAQGQKLKDGIQVFLREMGLQEKLRCVGLAPRFELRFLAPTPEEAMLWKSYFQQEVLKRGILFNGVHNISQSHSHVDIEQTLLAYRDALRLWKRAVEQGEVQAQMEGELLQPVFRRP